QAPAATHVRKLRPRKIVKHDRDGGDEDALARLADRLNNNTVTVISGGLQSTDLAIAHELAAALDDGDNLRVVPMVGAGGGRNIRDVRFLKGVDLGITQTYLLTRLRASNESGPLDDKIVYLAKLYNEEMHLLVRADSGLAAIEQLGGRTVSLGEQASGTQLIAHDVLDRLGIAVHEVN